ncbi:MAG TPA: hypothetical protein VGL59_04110, partial [Polyangia bacterium]
MQMSSVCLVDAAIDRHARLDLDAVGQGSSDGTGLGRVLETSGPDLVEIADQRDQASKEVTAGRPRLGQRHLDVFQREVILGRR